MEEPNPAHININSQESVLYSALPSPRRMLPYLLVASQIDQTHSHQNEDLHGGTQHPGNAVTKGYIALTVCRLLREET